MKRIKGTRTYLVLIAILGVVAIIGCTPPAGPDTTPPTVASTVPVIAASGVARSTTVKATFSEAMDPATIVAANFTLTAGATKVTGAVTYDTANMALVFTPASSLANLTLFTATVTTGVKDVAGNALAANHVWTFTTADTIPPTVVSTSPVILATNVAINTSVTATFSQAMDPATITTTNFTLAPAVAGKVTYNLATKTATFAPTAALANNTTYTATVKTGAKDLAGNALAANKVWTFKTIVAAPLGPAPVLLGTAGNYVILAKTAITDVPASAITGDIGISPAAETFITGFSQTDVQVGGVIQYATSPQVTGFLFAADMVAPTSTNLTTAVSDMQTAYTDAAGRTAGVGPNLNLGGGTIGTPQGPLAPGTYTWGTGVDITTDLTLSGAANDVWLFQIAGNLTLENGVHLILSGGAQAKNVFWQLSGIATLGTTSQFAGIILSQTQIILQTGASLTGRALAQTQVALDTNAVTAP